MARKVQKLAAARSGIVAQRIGQIRILPRPLRPLLRCYHRELRRFRFIARFQIRKPENEDS